MYFSAFTNFVNLFLAIEGLELVLVAVYVLYMCLKIEYYLYLINIYSKERTTGGLMHDFVMCCALVIFAFVCWHKRCLNTDGRL